MEFELFTNLVAAAGVVYAGIARYLQLILVNREEMEKIQAESKKLSEELKKAKERNDKKEMEKIMQKQMDFLPKMNKIMFGQFKPLIVILLIFFAFNHALGVINPFVQDDIQITLLDDGKGCDVAAGDGIFSGCYEISGQNSGKWYYTAKAMKDGSELALNQTYFYYNSEGADTYTDPPKGQAMAVETDKDVYSVGDTVALYAQPPQENAEIVATLSNGTSFLVELPFTIPVLNVTRIYSPYWWFIFVAFISGLGISFILGRYKKMVKKK